MEWPRRHDRRSCFGRGGGGVDFYKSSLVDSAYEKAG